MTVLTLRKDLRLTHSARVQYRGAEGLSGEGLIRDLSVGGARMTGDVPVSVGMTLILCLSLPGRADAVEIDQVTVQWVNGSEFGVDLGTLPPAEAEHLMEVIGGLVETDDAHEFRLA